MRIALACSHFWPSHGGLETVVSNLGARLAARGHSVTVVTAAHPQRVSDTWRGMRIVSLPYGEGEHGVNARGQQLMGAYVATGPYDAAAFFGDPMNGVCWAAGAVPKARMRVLLQPVINEDGLGRWGGIPKARRAIAAMLRRADAIIAMTRHGASDRFFREEGLETVFIPNAAERAEPSADFRARRGIAPEAPLFVHVANLWPVKNHAGVLEAVRRVPGTWAMRCLGRDAGFAEVTTLVQRTAAADPRIGWIADAESEEVAAALTAASVSVLGSHGEGSPVSVLEAMAHGTPWIAAPTCGSVHEQAGGIVAPLTEWPMWLDLLARSAQLRETLGRLGAQHWRDTYAWDVVVPRWEAALAGQPVAEPARHPAVEASHRVAAMVRAEVQQAAARRAGAAQLALAR